MERGKLWTQPSRILQFNTASKTQIWVAILQDRMQQGPLYTGVTHYGITEKEGWALCWETQGWTMEDMGLEGWLVDIPWQSGKARTCVFIWLEFRMFDEGRGRERETEESQREASGHGMRATGLSHLRACPVSVLPVIWEHEFPSV